MLTTGGITYFSSPGGTSANPPVVLIHGAGGDHLVWPHQIRRLPGFRVFAPDLPGHGRSTGAGKQLVSAYAQDVIGWLNEVGIYQAVFVGHSMGGAVALSLALDYPQHVAGLGLLGTGARLKVHPQIFNMLARPELVQDALDMIVSWSYAGEIANGLRAKAIKQLSQTRPAVLHGDYLACNAFDVMERLGDIVVPALVLCGQSDRLTPPKYSHYLTEHIPNARLEIIPDAGHMVMQEQPHLVANALLEFLAALPH
ncbi:MAG: alpha/beta hydrolase [Anaerolineae bacterium]|nr:alpha/beta hydrolase [Anaerolineae bacterium]